MSTRVFKFHSGRLVRNFVSCPGRGMPNRLHHLGKDDQHWSSFQCDPIGFSIGVAFTAIRFRMEVTRDEIKCGRLRPGRFASVM